VRQAQTALHTAVCRGEVVHIYRNTDSRHALQAPLHFFCRIS
jgi:hypothetical protein